MLFSLSLLTELKYIRGEGVDFLLLIPSLYGYTNIYTSTVLCRRRTKQIQPHGLT